MAMVSRVFSVLRQGLETVRGVKRLMEGYGMMELFENYRNFLDKVDRFYGESAAFYADALTCAKGCSGCCRHFGLFPVEAVHVRLALDDLDQKTVEDVVRKALVRLDDPEGACPLLQEDLCLLYPVRPVICRTHGLPVLVRSEEGSRVDVCPLNFTSDIKPDSRYILDLDQLNTTLFSINDLFLKQAFDGGDAPERLLLAEALLMDLDF